MESIASLRDIQTVEVFFLNAKQAIFKVSTFLRTVSNYFMLGMINELVTPNATIVKSHNEYYSFLYATDIALLSFTGIFFPES